MSCQLLQRVAAGRHVQVCRVRGSNNPVRQNCLLIFHGVLQDAHHRRPGLPSLRASNRVQVLRGRQLEVQRYPRHHDRPHRLTQQPGLRRGRGHRGVLVARLHRARGGVAHAAHPGGLTELLVQRGRLDHGRSERGPARGRGVQVGGGGPLRAAPRPG